MSRHSGFVLLNALVVVIAISAIATTVLQMSARATARLTAVQADAQLSLYLDGAAALIVTFLEQEWEENGTDHLGELWASDTLVVPIDRGQIGADLADMQGRLNVNRLGSGQSRGDFERLFETLKLPAALLTAVEEFVSDGGPANIGPYLTRDPPVLPPGGAIDVLDSLRAVEGMTDAAFDALRPVLTALPLGTPINVNTAPSVVLQSMMPDLRATEIARIVRTRETEPYASGVDFRARMVRLLGENALSDLPVERLTAASSYFEAMAAAEIQGRTMRRRMIVYRDAVDGTANVLFSIPVPTEAPNLPSR